MTKICFKSDVMKKILFLVLFMTPLSVAHSFDPGDTFYHGYTIHNNFSCSIKITNIEKCYSTSNQNPSSASIFTNVMLRSGVFQTGNSGCYSYNPDYTIPGNTSDSGWDITFYTDSSVLGAQVDSSLSYDFEIQGSCVDNGSVTTTSVTSSILWMYCGDGTVNLAETCDYNDTTQTGWGTNGCTTTCQADNSSGWWWSGWWSWGGSSGGSGWWSSGSSWSNVCWDGSLQRPNDDGINEQCDFWSASDWWVCNKTTCAWWDLTAPGHYYGDITVPNNGRITFGPRNDVIIWHGMNPFVETLQKPYIQNESDFSVYFDDLCVVRASWGNTLSGISPQCETIGTLQPGEKRIFSRYPNFVANKENITSGSYGDNTLITTLRDSNILYENAYFRSLFQVRVSRPSVVTTGWGTSVLSDTTGIANIEEVADEWRENEKSGENKNFVWPSISSGDVSSNTSDLSDASVVDDIVSERNDLFDSLEDVWQSSRSTTVVTDLWEFESYNGIENVFILKWKHFRVLDDTFDSLAGPRTYIVDAGDIFIDANINYPSNIAFVVKWGDIQIDKEVTFLKGTYISIAQNSFGGSILGLEPTSNVLKVQGSLYGDITELVGQRTYINESANGQIHVGTIVSFGSSLFRKPAPLTWQFISEYLESEKIAR